MPPGVAKGRARGGTICTAPLSTGKSLEGAPPCAIILTPDEDWNLPKKY